MQVRRRRRVVHHLRRRHVQLLTLWRQHRQLAHRVASFPVLRCRVPRAVRARVLLVGWRLRRGEALAVHEEHEGGACDHADAHHDAVDERRRVDSAPRFVQRRHAQLAPIARAHALHARTFSMNEDGVGCSGPVVVADVVRGEAGVKAGAERGGVAVGRGADGHVVDAAHGNVGDGPVHRPNVREAGCDDDDVAGVGDGKGEDLDATDVAVGRPPHAVRLRVQVLPNLSGVLVAHAV
mmetsp:Transcript_20286/g.34894  ORF Transcript_20286/g.34894 Transcript_20286/m.34894 type:complete len:237 (+) Transcript_20286:208-918(+)